MIDDATAELIRHLQNQVNILNLQLENRRAEIEALTRETARMRSILESTVTKILRFQKSKCQETSTALNKK